MVSLARHLSLASLRPRGWLARATAAAAAAMLAGGVVVAVGSTPAAAATVDTSSWYVLLNRNSNKALDLYNFATNDGARITQWTRNNGNQQQWQFVDSGGGYYRLKSRHSGKVLDVANWSTADGAAVNQWTDQNAANQQFRLVDSDAGYVRLVNRNSNKAVEVQNASTADGANVVQYADWNGANQQWQLVRVDGGTTPTTPPPSGSGTAGCGKAPGLASGTHTIASSGKNRSFILRIPSNYNQNTPYRLVFGFHWWGGTAIDVDTGQTVDRNTWSYYGLQRLANNSTIFVAPQGIGNGWANSGGEDVTFVDDMLSRIEAALCVNTRQRFSIGFSYGGAMSFSLACSRPSIFRAVVVQSSPGTLSGCSGGSQPVAYMGVHGIGDNIASGRALRDRFVTNNGCTPQSPREPSAGSLTHVVTTYSGCRSGYPVVWAAFDGGHIAAPQDGAPGDSGPRTWVPAAAWGFITQFQ
ncbi:RICIN domain-containing protein [Micromonospora sp. DH14]|uniref:RICIN domain-containing protein n=1 Tax=Micromonospora sp. DH14 TaxID=3040120 RepID=UPI00244205B6|nr:RICIN domain-containing protein [Micromonospora sp. DH14]MDG9674737.1 RICIN domain-containing protein [Micromonospora sp. DH14]